MRRDRYSAVGAFGLLVAAGCGSAEQSSRPALVSGRIELRVGESRPVPGTSLRIRFDAVSEESRCPAKVVCIWEGNGQIKLRVQRPAGDTTIALNTNSPPKQADLDGITLALERLTPEPREPGPVPASDYRATIRVTQGRTRDGS